MGGQDPNETQVLLTEQLWDESDTIEPNDDTQYIQCVPRIV